MAVRVEGVAGGVEGGDAVFEEGAEEEAVGHFDAGVQFAEVCGGVFGGGG